LRTHAKAAIVVAVLLLSTALGASAAPAAQVYVPAQTFSGPGSDPGQLSNPRRAAVEQATGNLFVADSGNGRVQVFDGEGNFLTAFGEAELDAPFGLAIRESGGETEIYVSDPATEQIVRYDSDEQATPGFSVDAGFTSPAAGAGQLKVGDFAAPLAVDPTNGDLWVGDPGDDRAQRYDSSGGFELANDGSDSPGGVFTGLLDLATDSAGRLYVVDSDGFITGQPDGTFADGQSRVERFSAACAHQLTLSGLTRPATVATDLATDQVAVSADQDNVDYNGEPSLHVYDSSGAKFDELRMGPATQFTTVQGLAWRTADQDVFSVNDVGYWNGSPSGTPSINRFELTEEATAAIDPVSGITTTSAELNGTVDPNGNTTTARFEISSDGGSTWKELEELAVCEVSSPGDCTGPEAVSFTATGLVPNTAYSVRLTARSVAGSIHSSVETFSTDQRQPAAVTVGASTITQTTAKLNGTVDPFALPTTYYFEYGTAPGAYTVSVPASEDGDAGAGQGLDTVSQSIFGLDPETTYYFRLVATNSQGTALGAERSFTTLAPGVVPPDIYFHVGDFTEARVGSGPGEMNSPARLAVEYDTGNVFLADGGNGRIQVFEPQGDGAPYLTEFGAGVLSSPFGIAIDQSSGDVYVSDPGLGKIVKFNSDGGSTPSFSVDPAFTSPAAGSGPGQIADFRIDIEVDRSSGELVVADSGNRRVQRFEPDGTPVPGGTFDGSTSPRGPFAAVPDIAVTAEGNVIVVDLGVPRVEEFSATGAFRLRYAYSLASQEGLVEVDPNTGYVLVGRNYGWEPGPNERITIFDGPDPIGEVFMPNPGVVSINGFDVRAGGGGELYVVSDRLFGCCGSLGGFVFRAGARPLVEIDPVSDPGDDTATFSGAVNPRALETTWRFEYSSDGEDWFAAPYPYGPAGNGSEPVPVGTDVEALHPDTEYRVRLVAQSPSGIATSAVETFTTDPGPPTVDLLGATKRTPTAARLNARVNPNGLETTYYFEYGMNSSYGTSVPLSEDGEAGDGREQAIVSEQISGLEPGTEYHYRVVAESSAGVTVGPDVAFRTRTLEEADLEPRGIELVNQPQKGNQDVGLAHLALEGDSVRWSTPGGAPGSAHPNTFMVSRRTLQTPQGWEATSALPPIATVPSGATVSVAASNPQQTKFLLEVSLTDGSISFYRYEPGSEALEFLFNRPQNMARPCACTDPPVEVSRDLSRVFVGTRKPMDPEHPDGTYQVYEVSDGQPELVSLMPDGEPASCGNAEWGNFFNAHAEASGDGSHVFFTEPVPNGSDCNGPRALYVRDVDAGTTTRISAPSLDGLEKPVRFLRATFDGTKAIFTTDGRLEDRDVNTTKDIYLWTEGEGLSCLTCISREVDVEDDENIGRYLRVSDDFTTVFFASRHQLVPGKGEQFPAATEVLNLYSLKTDGTDLTYISPWSAVSAGAVMEAPWLGTAAGGHVVYFLSDAPNATYEQASGPQYYRYDDRDLSLECMSCARPGVAGAGLFIWARFRPTTGMSADGNVAAFVTDAPLDPYDINGVNDVYEWRYGQIRLVTDGKTPFPSGSGAVSLIGISEDGEDVIFRAGAHLTGYEADRANQIYDARLGGGRLLPPEEPPCVEDDCQGPLEPVPPLPQQSSGSFVGSGNQVADAKTGKRKRCRAKARKGKGPKKAKARCARKRGSK
jgi:hypothetical protein